MCKAAKADLVFMVDGSWSIGDENFHKIINFLHNTVGALDKIGADGTQVRPADQSLIHSMHWIITPGYYYGYLLGNMGKEL